MANKSSISKKGGSWTRVGIFISLYVLLLESLIEWVLVLYLFGNKHVDSKMAPGLILALIASFFTVPLVSLHSLLAWQYHKTSGFSSQKAILDTACTYILRATVIIWLAASVAGLVVVSQQAPCLPDDASGSFWKVGVSCGLYRASVIVSVLSFVTVCIYFCSRELCDHPYDISLFRVYNQQQASRDNSIFSNSSWDSENTIKNEILWLCRRPDAPYDQQGLYWASGDETIVEKPDDNLCIQHPTPIHPKPQLRINTNFASKNAEFVRGSSTSPSERASLAATNSNPISRTSTTLTSRTPNDFNFQVPFIAELPTPEVPPIPTKFSHKRAKSSVSSLRRFLPKTFPLSLPLSADPQILALADPKNHPDLEKQVEKASDPKSSPSQLPSTRADSPPPPVPVVTKSTPLESNPTVQHLENSQPRLSTINFADAPEVVPPGPLRVHKASAADIIPVNRSTHHPHHPNYMSAPQLQMIHHPVRGPSFRTPSTEPDRIRRHNTRPYSTGRRHSQAYQFEQSQIPRTQSQYHPHAHYGRYEPQRKMAPYPRRNDVEIIYSSTRRPRSSTYAGLGSSCSHLDSIKESRASVDEPRGHHSSEDTGNLINEHTYRGVNRTSNYGF